MLGPPPLTTPYAAALRRAGIVTETHFRGNLKKQMQRSASRQCAVIVTPTEVQVRDMWSGIQRPCAATPDAVVRAVQDVHLNGYYNPDETYEQHVARVDAEITRASA